MKEVAEELKVNTSSAKNVIAIYKREGRIEKKKTRLKRSGSSQKPKAEKTIVYNYPFQHMYH